MIHAYTGDGKGKTTAALGLLIRAFGAKKKVGIIFFDKGCETYRHNELVVLDRLDIKYHLTGLERMMPDKQFRFGVTDDDIAEALRGLELAKTICAQNALDLLVLDEALTSVEAGLITYNSLLEVIENVPENTELILTGRCTNQDLLDKADLVTSMIKQKHYFDKGIKARAGIEF